MGFLPMWDRGHEFVGAEGAGSCMHSDQAWWSNVGKNFLGDKLVALWKPEEAEAAMTACKGELFRAPLTETQLRILGTASCVALLRPGDVFCFSGGVPHITMVVGDALNFTGYESFLNWHPDNHRLLLSGFARERKSGVMGSKHLNSIVDDVLNALQHFDEGGSWIPKQAAAPQCSPEEMLSTCRAIWSSSFVQDLCAVKDSSDSESSRSRSRSRSRSLTIHQAEQQPVTQ